jgi:hypothetical protein
MTFVKGGPRPPNAGRRRGTPNKATERHRRLLASVDANDKAINDNVIAAAVAGDRPAQGYYYKFLRPPPPKLNLTPTAMSEPKTIEDVRKATAELLVKVQNGEVDLDAAGVSMALLKLLGDNIVGTDLQKAVDELKAKAQK